LSFASLRSVAGLHHFDLDPDPDPAWDFDPDPDSGCNFDANRIRFGFLPFTLMRIRPDPDPRFQIKIQNRQKVLK
jgi:hypothetical protein